MESDGAGRIILLNGTSSSGKTTLVRALQDLLPDPWIEIGIDRFVLASGFPDRPFARLGADAR